MHDELKGSVLRSRQRDLDRRVVLIAAVVHATAVIVVILEKLHSCGAKCAECDGGGSQRVGVLKRLQAGAGRGRASARAREFRYQQRSKRSFCATLAHGHFSI